MNDKEFLEQVKAREELESKGYKRIPCQRCKGTGLDPDPPEIGNIPCWSCGGKGYSWQAPMEK